MGPLLLGVIDLHAPDTIVEMIPLPLHVLIAAVPVPDHTSTT